jgi:pyrroloquinoline-quinone synthase
MASTPHVPAIYWAEVAERPSFETAIEAVSSAYDFRRHPYFLWAASPATPREAFQKSQVPFRYAVEGWAQAVSAVLARIPRLELRLGLVKNIADEHGEAFEQSHKASFRRYLAALGTPDDELATPCPIAVRAFQQATTNFCLVHAYEAGAAALGMIEHLYIGISADIGQLLAERGFTEPGSQDHYAIHEALDVEHAKDLLDLARPAWAEARGRSEVALGLLLGAHHFWQLYLDLLPAT